MQALAATPVTTLRGLIGDNPGQEARSETIAARYAEWKELQNSLFQHSVTMVADGSLEDGRGSN
jgi:hypothetical protein